MTMSLTPSLSLSREGISEAFRMGNEVVASERRCGQWLRKKKLRRNTLRENKKRTDFFSLRQQCCCLSICLRVTFQQCTEKKKANMG